MKHPTWCCLIFKSECHSTLSISCSFLSNSKGQCALLFLSPLGKPQTQFILNITKVSDWLHPVNSRRWRDSESKSSLISLELSHLLHYLLSSMISLMSSISPHSQCLWLCHQDTKASLFSCFHLHFHPVFRPFACDSTFNQTNFALLLWCCESRENQVAADKCSVACHFS